MPFGEALFWFGFTILGITVYFLVEKYLNTPGLIALTIIGAAAVSYSVYLQYHPTSPNPPLWVLLLILTWGLIIWNVYDRHRMRSVGAGGTESDTAKTLSPPRHIYTVSFEYMPVKKPLGNGWKDVGLPDHQYNPKGLVQFDSDPDIAGSLRMKVTNGVFAMHYDLPPHSTSANQIEFRARYSTTTMMHLLLTVSTRDDSAQRRVFIQIQYGKLNASQAWPNPNPGRDMQKWLPEQILYWDADVLADGCLGFRLPLDEVVKTLLGSEGWIFKAVEGIRLRGDISISPIILKLSSTHVSNTLGASAS